MKERNKQFNLYLSDSIQSLNLLYEHSLVTHSIAVIFVNTEYSSKYDKLDGKKRETMLFQRYVVEI